MKRKHEVNPITFPEIKTKIVHNTFNALGENYLHIYKLRKDFNLVLKILKDSASTTCSGRLFQSLTMRTKNEYLYGLTTKRLQNHVRRS